MGFTLYIFLVVIQMILALVGFALILAGAKSDSKKPNKLSIVGYILQFCIAPICLVAGALCLFFP